MDRGTQFDWGLINLPASLYPDFQHAWYTGLCLYLAISYTVDYHIYEHLITVTKIHDYHLILA